MSLVYITLIPVTLVIKKFPKRYNKLRLNINNPRKTKSSIERKKMIESSIERGKTIESSIKRRRSIVRDLILKNNKTTESPTQQTSQGRMNENGMKKVLRRRREPLGDPIY